MPQSKSARNVCFWGLWFIFFCFFILIAGLLETRIVNGLRSEHWIKTTGILLKARDEGSAGEPNFTVRYLYNIDGQNFSGDELSYRLFDDTDHYVAMEGKQIAVYYDPKNPARSVLIKGVGAAPILFAVIPLVHLVLLSALAFLALRRGTIVNKLLRCELGWSDLPRSRP